MRRRLFRSFEHLHALRAADERRSFRELVAADPVVTAALPPALRALGCEPRVLLPGFPAIRDSLEGLWTQAIKTCAPPSAP